jgi:hypothetical protein
MMSRSHFPSSPFKSTSHFLCLACLGIALLTATAWAQQASARGRGFRQPRQLYVAPTGDDANPGSAERPFRTIQKGADAAAAGDTVTITGGVYRERIVLHRSGNYFDRSIHLRAAPDQKVIIDANGVPAAGGGREAGARAIFDTNGQDHLRITGLCVQNARGLGFYVVGSWDVQLEECRSCNTTGSGIMVDKSGKVTVTRCEIERACQGGSEESLSVKRSQEVTVSRCHIHHTGHEGVDVKEGSKNVRILNNDLHHVERQALYAEAWDSSTCDIRFEGNRVHDCMFGMAAGSESGGLLRDVWFVNNLVYTCKGPGMIVADWGGTRFTHPVQDVYFINNTIYGNGGGGRNGTWGGGMVFENTQAQNVVVVNNILSHNGLGQLVTVSGKRPAGLVVRNNLIDGPSEQIGEDNVIGDAKFVDAAHGDFHLQPGSPARDAGADQNPLATDADGNPRRQGDKIDLGAYEAKP